MGFYTGCDDAILMGRGGARPASWDFEQRATWLTSREFVRDSNWLACTVGGCFSVMGVCRVCCVNRGCMIGNLARFMRFSTKCGLNSITGVYTG